MINDMNLNDLRPFLEMALRAEYEWEDIDINGLILISKHSKATHVELVLKGMIDGSVAIFDVFYDNQMVGIDWVWENLNFKNREYDDFDD